MYAPFARVVTFVGSRPLNVKVIVAPPIPSPVAFVNVPCMNTYVPTSIVSRTTFTFNVTFCFSVVMFVNGTGCPSINSPVVALLGLYLSSPMYDTFTWMVPFVSTSIFTIVS